MAYNFGIQEARITYANPVKQVYNIYLSAEARTMRAVPAGIGRLQQATVNSAETYSIGDIVLVVLGESGIFDTASIDYAIILCHFPGNINKLVDVEQDVLNAESGYSASYYDTNEKAYNLEDSFTGFNYSDGNRGAIVSGDCRIGGKETELHLTDREVSIGSADAKISTNSLDGSITADSIVKSSTTPGSTDSVRIVNETVLRTSETYGGLNGRHSVNIREQSGDLPYGFVRTILDDNGQALSQVEQLLDGTVVLRSATGIILERTVDITSTADKYEQLIVGDPKIPKASADTAKPFARTEDSDRWDTLSRGVKGTDQLIPSVAPVPDPVSDVDVPDSLGTKTTKTTKATSTIAQYPDGSIVFCDAWGSEIRMFNGDIQFSAANKITAIADTDILQMCGGVAAVKADAGIQAMTNFGHVDIASGKQVNLTATEDINVAGDANLNLVAKQDILTESVNLSMFSEELTLIETVGDLFSSARTQNIHVIGDWAVTTPQSILRVSTDSIDLAAGATNIHSNVEISDKSYDPGEFPEDYTVSLTAASGSLRVASTITGDSGITVASTILTHGAVYATQYCALDVSPDTGVYSIKKLPKIDTEAKEHKSSSKYSKNKVAEFWKKLESFPLSDILKSAFTAISKNVAIILPKFANDTKNRRPSAVGVHVVDVAEKSVYIYPGKDFWEGDSVYIPNTDNIVNSESLVSRMTKITTRAKQGDYYEQS